MSTARKPRTGWYTSDVTINWWVDDPEGPATPGAGCAQTTVTTDTNNGAVTFTCTATSEGGTSTGSVSILRDARPPFVWVARPESTLYRLNSTNVASLSCSDSGSGLASCVATRPAGTPFDTSTPGEHTFTVTATDHVGHTTVVNRTYWVSSGACDARPEGLISWWPGDYDYRDVIGGHDGVLTNAPFGEFVSGISRGSMRFMFPDGKWVQVGDTPALELQGAMTLSAWVFSGGTNVIGVIAGREGEYLLGRHADGRIRYSIANTNPGWGWVDTNVYVEQSLYTHLALTYDGSEIRLYKNGQVAYSRAAHGEIGDALPAMNDFRIGARQDPADPSEYAGLIDNVEVAGRAFSQAEIERGFLAAPHGHCVDPSALTIESPQRATYGQTLTNVVARLTRAGVPSPTPSCGSSSGGFQSAATPPTRTVWSWRRSLLPANLAVGTYPNAVEARVDTNAVLAGSSATADFVVDRKVPVVEWNTPLPIVYGTALNGAQLNARGYTDAGLNHGNLVYSMAWGSVPNAGTHTVSVTFTPWDTAHYTTATASVSLVVNRANPLVEVYGYTVPYGGTPKSVTGRVIDNGNTYPGLLPLNITYNGSPDAPVNAGTYEVVGSYPGNANYNAATGSTTLTIEKAAATVTATGGTFTYDGQPHARDRFGHRRGRREPHAGDRHLQRIGRRARERGEVCRRRQLRGGLELQRRIGRDDADDREGDAGGQRVGRDVHVRRRRARRNGIGDRRRRRGLEPADHHLQRIVRRARQRGQLRGGRELRGRREPRRGLGSRDAGDREGGRDRERDRRDRHVRRRGARRHRNGHRRRWSVSGLADVHLQRIARTCPVNAGSYAVVASFAGDANYAAGVGGRDADDRQGDADGERDRRDVHV